ncbi:MAG: NB-ARC domain-containing protein [Calothrix sp. MO_192.B10]|nr:NB-ARC domain-containing protein [Calothrix sp. MO_192.B10]
MNITVNESQLPDAFINEVATQQGVTKTELDALRLALKGFSGPEISEKLSISQAAVRKRLGESYKKFQIPGSSNKKIYELKKSLNQQYQARQPKNQQTSEDWGEAVDVEDFRGRAEEISELTQWIVNQRCRLVAVLGLGGIGKTILAAKITKEVGEGDEFEYVIWRSLRNSPRLNDILTEILRFLPNDKQADLDLEDGNHNKKILWLIDTLRKHRCLVILDNVDSLLSSSKGKNHELAGNYRDEYKNYGDLFKKVAETSHQSCLLLTSREKPLEVAMLEGKNLPVKVLQLTGLNLEDASAILKDKGITDSTYSKAQLQELVRLYSGNPLALKMVATTLYELFNNNLGEFLSQINKETAVYGDVRTLLAEQFHRLSELEKGVMYWLAIDRDCVSLAQIKKDLMTPDKMKILEAVESLLRRSLIEKVAGVGARRFSPQSVVIEYVTERLIAQATEEIIRGGDFKIINGYPLIKARSLDYFRKNQERSILEPLKKQLVGFFGNEKELESHLQNILQQLQKQPLAKKGYVAGNIINLLRHLQINKSQISLDGWDFSNLTIWQAYFKDVRLQNTRFTNSDVTGSVFRDTMSSLVSVSFSHDGTYFATGVMNGEVRLWQTDGVKQLRILRGHTGWVWTFAFSPDNKILASGSADYKIKLWNISSGECIHTLSEHTNKVYSVGFNGDGTLLASASEDQSIKIWDVKTGKCKKTLTGHTGWVWSVSFHPTKPDIVASGSGDGSIRLWNIDSGECQQILLGHYGDVYAIDFHPDGQLLVSCGIDKTIKLWELATGDCKQDFSAHDRKIYKVRFNADGSLIASCSEDQTIKLWDTGTGKCKRTLSGHTSQVWDVAFHPAGRTLISSSDDQTARVWNVETGTCWNILQGYTRDVYSLAFSPDSKILASGGDDKIIRLWELQNFECHQLRSHQGRIRTVAFSPDGQTLASGSADRQIKLWDIQNVSDGQEIATLTGHENWVWCVVFSPDGQTLASSSEDHTIRLWNVNTRKCIRVFKGHSHWVWAVAFSPDGKTLASGSADSTVKLWDVATGKCIQTLHAHKDLVSSVAFSPDGKTLASGSEDKTIKLWDVNTGKCLYNLNKHNRQVYSVSFSPDGKMLATASGDRTVKLWQAQTGALLDTLANGHTQPIRCVAFSPNGKLLASGGEDEKIQLWDLQTRKPLQQLDYHRFYEGMEITNITGLTSPEKASLTALGAVANKK